MRLQELNLHDSEPQKLARALSTVLVNLSKDNFKVFELKGNTNSTADTKTEFRHAMGQQPQIWWILEGRIYVPRDGASENNIDVRSAFASESFRMLIVA